MELTPEVRRYMAEQGRRGGKAAKGTPARRAQCMEANVASRSPAARAKRKRTWEAKRKAQK